MATILDGETDSDTIDLTGKRMVGLVVSGFSGTNLAILYQAAPDVWLPTMDTFGRARGLAARDGWITTLDVEQRNLSQDQTFRLRSDTPQDGDCSVTIVTEVA